MSYTPPSITIVHDGATRRDDIVAALRDLDEAGLKDVILTARGHLDRLADEKRVTGARVLVEFAARNGVTVRDLTGPGKTQPLAAIRQACMWEMRQRCGHLSFPAIGKLLGGRDHATIIHGVKRHAQRMAMAAE